MRKSLLEEMTWEEVEEALKVSKTVIVPWGSTEEHGYHLPLATDSLIAYEIAKRAAERTKALVAPPINYGLCRRTAPFPGTVTISFDTVRDLMWDICKSLYNGGFRRIIIFPGHLGAAHLTALEMAAQILLQTFPELKIAIVDLPRMLRKLKGLIEDEKDLHAGEIETSMVLAINRSLVAADKLVAEHPVFPDHIVIKEPRRYMTSGIIGDATKASEEKGKMLLEVAVQGLSNLVMELE
ncbi:MAG: creatininase family protein [Candidatus Bathyarchaeia archaeon]